MSNPQASAVPVQINGKSFRVSPLTDRNIGEVNHYLRSKAIKTARESLDKDTPPDLVDATLRIAIQEASKIDWTDDVSLIMAPDCMMYIFWLSLQREHPNYTQEDFSQDVGSDPECLARIMDAFNICQPFMTGSEPATEGNSKSAGKPKKATKKKQ